MKRTISSFMMLLAVAGCAPQTRLDISNFDGKPIDPVTLEKTTTECKAKAEVSSASVPYAWGSSGSLARSIEQSNVATAAFKGCMAEKGMRVNVVPVETASTR